MSDDINALKEKFTTREIYFYNMIHKFYKKCDTRVINKMIDIINGKSDISLRILDWFVTRYSDRNKIMIANGSELMDIHISYKAQLKSYKKKYFDPFKRREKFEYNFKEVNKKLCTTIGQLNFFRWMIENHILEYIDKNYDFLSSQMNSSNRNDKKRKKEKTINKQINLFSKTKQINSSINNINVNISKKINNENVRLVLTFD